MSDRTVLGFGWAFAILSLLAGIFYMITDDKILFSLAVPFGIFFIVLIYVKLLSK